MPSPQVSARLGAPEDTAADTRVVGLFEGESLADPALQRLVELGEAKPGLKKVALAHEAAPGGGQRRVLIAGLGARAELDPERARVAAGAAAARAKELGAVSLSWAAPAGEGVAAGLVEGTLLRLYSFERFKSKPSDDGENPRVESLENDPHLPREVSLPGNPSLVIVGQRTGEIDEAVCNYGMTVGTGRRRADVDEGASWGLHGTRVPASCFPLPASCFPLRASR